jgi:hypothetical protein
MEYYSTPTCLILRGPIKVSPRLCIVYGLCLVRLYSQTFFYCGKCDSMERLWAAVLSGRGALSWKIVAFRASQMPQLMMRGRALSSLNLGSWVQASHACSKLGPPHYSFVQYLLKLQSKLSPICKGEGDEQVKVVSFSK